MWMIFKVFTEFVTILLLVFCFFFKLWFFSFKACGILTPRLRIEPAALALEGEAFTTGPPGKSHDSSFNNVLKATRLATPKYDYLAHGLF